MPDIHVLVKRNKTAMKLGLCQEPLLPVQVTNDIPNKSPNGGTCHAGPAT
jgi:hypothetical protein